MISKTDASMNEGIERMPCLSDWIPSVFLGNHGDHGEGLRKERGNGDDVSCFIRNHRFRAGVEKEGSEPD
jgi:hypothetical protein